MAIQYMPQGSMSAKPQGGGFLDGLMGVLKQGGQNYDPNMYGGGGDIGEIFAHMLQRRAAEEQARMAQNAMMSRGQQQGNGPSLLQGGR